MKTKKTKKTDSEDWLTTYGDLVTLLLVFFILLVAFSQIDVKKFKVLAQYISESFGSGENIISETQGAGKSIIDLDLIAREIESKIKLMNLEKSVKVVVENGNIVIRGKGDAFFPSGKAILTPKIKRFLQSITPVLKSNDKKISVEGHTDDLPIHSRIYPSNWELSSARASSVIRFFTEEMGIDPKRFRAIGYAQFKPLYIPIPANRAKNRRIEIVIHGKKNPW